MEYDVFFSISQTPVAGGFPSEHTMLEHFFNQAVVADEEGYGVAWIAQAHLSTEIQKRNKKPVVPHWKGEVGLCTDFFQLAHHVFKRTKRIEVGSAVMSILCNGGPIGAAERIANFCSLHGFDSNEHRKVNIGFAAGRFEFMARPYGIVPRDEVEEVAWPALRGQIFMEAADVFLKLLRGDVLSSEDTYETILTRANFRSDEDWERVQKAAMNRDGALEAPTEIPISKRYVFEDLKIIPQNWRRDLLNLVLGSHDVRAQKHVNQILPVEVFNLSITQPEVIEQTHERMRSFYHKDGGEWTRRKMPRTVMVFLVDDHELSQAEQDVAAEKMAKKALSAYWSALQGTLDPSKVERAANNALIGSVETVAHQMVERFHPEDRIMLWFDFFNHNSLQVEGMMRSFMRKVAPRVKELLGN